MSFELELSETLRRPEYSDLTLDTIEFLILELNSLRLCYDIDFTTMAKLVFNKTDDIKYIELHKRLWTNESKTYYKNLTCAETVISNNFGLFYGKKKKQNIQKYNNYYEEYNNHYKEYTELLKRLYEYSKYNLLDKDKKQTLFYLQDSVKSEYKNRKTTWYNFNMFCKNTNRSEHHVKSYILRELMTQGSILEDGTLKIYGKFNNVQLKSVIKNYIKEYVLCSQCKSLHTHLQKFDALFKLVCSKCKSERTVVKLKFVK